MTTPRQDDDLLSATQALLRAHLPEGATLERTEVNDLNPEEPGYLYLRYAVPAGAPLEYWAHWGRRDHVGQTTGQVSVKAKPREASEAAAPEAPGTTAAVPPVTPSPEEPTGA